MIRNIIGSLNLCLGLPNKRDIYLKIYSCKIDKDQINKFKTLNLKKNAPLSGRSWKTEIFWLENLRPGPFSIGLGLLLPCKRGSDRCIVLATRFDQDLF